MVAVVIDATYGVQDFVLHQGVRWDMAFSAVQPDDTLFDITGYTPCCRAYRDTHLIVSTEGDSPAIAVDYQPDGQVDTFYLTIMGGITAQFWRPINGGGNLNYWIELVDELVADSNIPLLKGTFIIPREGPQP